MTIVSNIFKRYGRVLIAGTSLIVFGIILWQAVAAGGNPDPTDAHISHGASILYTAILVFREGLECIVVIAAVTASFVGANQSYRRPVAMGAVLGFMATIVTWFIAVAILRSIDAPALDIQAATGLLAIVVLLILMNWFFHKIYWTGWISLHNSRRRKLVGRDKASGQGATTIFRGLVLLGLTTVYREGFEVVLFLQSIRLQVGTDTVLIGASLGLLLTLTVGVLTFTLHQKLPYRQMLILTGVLLGGVLIVMVGENIQEMQLAAWIGTTPVTLPIPTWMGVWFAVFPNLESLIGQFLAALLVTGSYFGAEYFRVWRPRIRGEKPAQRPELPPTVQA